MGNGHRMGSSRSEVGAQRKVSKDRKTISSLEYNASPAQALRYL